MSQWGEQREINGCKFLPHIATDAFQPVNEGSLIDLVSYMGGGDESVRCKLYQGVIADRYTGRGHTCWKTRELDPKYMIGDILEWTFRKVGIKALTNIYKRMTGKDCGCRRRQNIFNQWNEIVLWQARRILKEYQTGEKQHV